MSEYIYKSHNGTVLLYHYVCPAKYRRVVIDKEVGTVRAKKDALRILRDELARKQVRGVVATGAMSDPYNLFEKGQLLTRNALSLLEAYDCCN